MNMDDERPSAILESMREPGMVERLTLARKDERMRDLKAAPRHCRLDEQQCIEEHCDWRRNGGLCPNLLPEIRILLLEAETEVSKCIVCRQREAAVPDRNANSLRKRVCRECHAARLTGDLRHVLAVHESRKAPRGGPDGK